MKLRKEEGLIFSKFQTNEFEIKDFALHSKNPEIIIAPKILSTTPVMDLQTSIRLHLSRTDWERFKQEVRNAGMSVCQVFSSYVLWFLKNREQALSGTPSRVNVTWIFIGKPRGKKDKEISRIIETG
ncbi:MAG: hypothetical protein ACTSUS_08705 [Candidatus Freyarchaeota archaeon]